MLRTRERRRKWIAVAPSGDNFDLRRLRKAVQVRAGTRIGRLRDAFEEHHPPKGLASTRIGRIIGKRRGAPVRAAREDTLDG